MSILFVFNLSYNGKSPHLVLYHTSDFCNKKVLLEKNVLKVIGKFRTTQNRTISLGYISELLFVMKISYKMTIIYTAKTIFSVVSQKMKQQLEERSDICTRWRIVTPPQALWGNAKRGIFFIFLNFFTFTRKAKKITFFL